MRVPQISGSPEVYTSLRGLVKPSQEEPHDEEDVMRRSSVTPPAKMEEIREFR